MSDALDTILQSTLEAIQHGKEEIFSIAEGMRSEMERLTQDLTRLKFEAQENIEKVDRQQIIEKRLRQKLMDVNRNYGSYSEQDMLKTYIAAKDAQVELQLLQEKELELRRRRDGAERSLRQMQETIDRAENLMTHVNMAFKLLQGGIFERAQVQSAEQKLEVGLQVIKAQEDERQRLARDLHDGPAQTLANVVLRLEIAEKLMQVDRDKVNQELHDLKSLVRLNLQEIRRIIFDLRPMALDDLGLIPALTKYVDNFRSSHSIEVDFRIEGRELRLIPSLEIAVFRLIQEGMTNVGKHAQSERVELTVLFQSDWITARIQDFGQGFNVAKTLDAPGEHYGLVGMRERVKIFSGEFQLSSENARGTTLEFKIPVSSERRLQHDSSGDC